MVSKDYGPENKGRFEKHSHVRLVSYRCSMGLSSTLETTHFLSDTNSSSILAWIIFSRSRCRSFSTHLEKNWGQRPVRSLFICLRCPPRLFLLWWKDGMRLNGKSSRPSGSLGTSLRSSWPIRSNESIVKYCDQWCYSVSCNTRNHWVNCFWTRPSVCIPRFKYELNKRAYYSKCNLTKTL